MPFILPRRLLSLKTTLMRKNLILFLSLALLSGACKKDHDDKNDSANTWNFKGTTYTAAAVLYVNGGSTANITAEATGTTATSADRLTFVFTTPPTSSGQLLITDSG